MPPARQTLLAVSVATRGDRDRGVLHHQFGIESLWMKLSTLNFLSHESRARHPAALLWFAAFISLQLVALFAFVRYFFRSTWDQQVSSGIWAVVLTGLFCSLLLCFAEYFFHRYLLHIETVRFLRAFCTSHLVHHKLTAIGFDDAKKTVRSTYPICDVAHDDQATFPPWGADSRLRSVYAVLRALRILIPTNPGSHWRVRRHCDRPVSVRNDPRRASPSIRCLVEAKSAHPDVRQVWRAAYGFHQAITRTTGAI